MDRTNRIVPWIALLVIFIILQLILIAADCRQTPAAVAKQSIQDYYYLDADMQQWLCTEQGDPRERVDQFLYNKRVEARMQGFETSFLRKRFTHLEVVTKHQDDKTATVHIEGTARTSINTAFMIIGDWFNLGRDYHVETTVELIRENGNWRVCGDMLPSGS